MAVAPAKRTDRNSKPLPVATRLRRAPPHDACERAAHKNPFSRANRSLILEGSLIMIPFSRIGSKWSTICFHAGSTSRPTSPIRDYAQTGAVGEVIAGHFHRVLTPTNLPIDRPT